MDRLFFDIVTSLPHTTESRLYGRRDYPARLLQVALLNAAGDVLFKSYVQPDELDWEQTSDGTYLSTSRFKRKRYPSKHQVIEQVKSLLACFEVVVYNLEAKWHFVAPFIRDVQKRSCSKWKSALYVERNRTGERDYNEALSYILYVPEHSSDTGLLDAESVARGSRELWLYSTDYEYRANVEARREYYQLNPIVEAIIYKERLPIYEQRARIYQQLEQRIFRAAGIIEPSYERSRQAREGANVLCEALTGHSLYLWEKYGEWMEAPLVSFPYSSHLTPDYKIKRLRSMQPESRLENRAYESAGNPYTFLFDLEKYMVGVDYVPIVQYPPGGTYSASALKKQFKLKDAQIKALRPVAHTHGLWGEYFLYQWPISDR